MKNINLPKLPTDEMSAGERLTTLQVLTGTHLPATHENLSQFCLACDNLTDSITASIKNYNAYSGYLSSEHLFYMYRQLRENIWHFIRVNYIMIASQYVSIYADYQKEMDIHLMMLNTAILEFQKLSINSISLSEQHLISEDEDYGFASDSLSDEENDRFSAFIYKVLPDEIRYVNEQLELLLMKNQQLHAICRSHRSNEELDFIFNTCNDRYCAEEMPKKLKAEEASIRKSMHDTGSSRHDELIKRYDKRSSALMDSTLGNIVYCHQEGQEGMAAEMMRLGMEKESFDDLYRDTNMVQYYGDELHHIINTQENNTCFVNEEVEEVKDTLVFKSAKHEALFQKNKWKVDKYMKQIGANGGDWVCVYQIFMFYLLKYKVEFPLFCNWLNDQYGRVIISETYARKLNSSYFVKNAGTRWSKKDALAQKNTPQMESKIWFYMTHLPEINEIIMSED